MELKTSLLRNQHVLSALDAEIIVVNGGGRLDLLVDIVTSVGAYSALRVIDIPTAPFNKSRCLNIGAWHSKASFLLLLDNDVVLSQWFPEDALELIEDGSFLTARTVSETNPEARSDIRRARTLPLIRERQVTIKTVLNDGRTASIEMLEGTDGQRSACGVIFLKRCDFIAVEGSNSNLTGWGFEDYDLQIRLQLARGLQRITVGELIHITHPMDSLPNLAASNSRNSDLCWRNYGKGDFDGTYSRDLAQRSLKFKEVPISPSCFSERVK